MPSNDRFDSVEFLTSDPGDGVDEELGSPLGFPRLRRIRLPLLVAAGVAVIALVVVNVVAGPKGTPSAGRATVTVSPTPALTKSSKTPAGHHSSIRLRVPHAQVSCAASASCDVWRYTPARVTAAIHDALPDARHLRTTTSTEHQDAPGAHLLDRRVIARVGKARLTIEVRPSGVDDELGWNASETAARTLVTVRDHVAGRLVSLRLVGAPGYHLDLDAARTLAADRRLASVRG